MLAFALSALGFGKMIAQAVFSWLSKRSLAELCCICLALACLMLLVSLKGEERHSRKLEAQLSKCAAAQKALQVQSKQQQQQVGKAIDHYVTVEKPEIVERVRKIESAPLPGNCKTPQAVSEADV